MRLLHQFSHQPNDLEKYSYLSQLQDMDETPDDRRYGFNSNLT
jgi:hypothetical protein